ncbi:MAG: 16S rRNA (cytosine(1402)-N(4))-methyltransferase RsmH, partial [Patescibacteria group bacterium]
SNAWEAEPPRTYYRSGIEPRSYPLIGSRLVLKQGNFAEIKELSRLNLDRVDGVLFDLGLRTELIEGGVASNAIQGEEKGQKGQGDQRGFSFMKDGPLDMRFDRSQSLTAREIVNGWPEEKLADIFENLGEERNYKKIARAIAAARGKNRIETTGELVAVIKEVIASNAIKTLARVFQALRMAVNSELENLKAGLEGAWDIVLPQGRIAVISFHSLEDRVVKNFFKEKQVIGTGETLTKKPVRPSAEEIRVNSRSRSAKLRAIIKK